MSASVVFVFVCVGSWFAGAVKRVMKVSECVFVHVVGWFAGFQVVLAHALTALGYHP